ncbi:hypothetical protein Bbelb_360960 [Branchiostoma belcheri]|nr:hypothetical protein Bbelb_360960 [Branchiostoma belcheri]
MDVINNAVFDYRATQKVAAACSAVRYPVLSGQSYDKTERTRPMLDDTGVTSLRAFPFFQAYRLNYTYLRLESVKFAWKNVKAPVSDVNDSATWNGILYRRTAVCDCCDLCEPHTLLILGRFSRRDPSPQRESVCTPPVPRRLSQSKPNPRGPYQVREYRRLEGSEG